MEDAGCDSEFISRSRKMHLQGKVINGDQSVKKRSPPYKKPREDSIDLTSKYVPPKGEGHLVRQSSGSDSRTRSITNAVASPARAVIRTSTSRAVARKMCSKPANPPVAPKPPEPEEDTSADDDGDLDDMEECVDLFEEDEEDLNYHNTGDKVLFCEVCGKQFSVEKQFIFHHRRHSSIDHYQCPKCLRGFVTLRACYSHELRKHKKDSMGTNGTGQKNDDSSDDEDESTSNRILASNSFQMYRGPPVKHNFECYDIDEKYGLRDRYPPAPAK